MELPTHVVVKSALSSKKASVFSYKDSPPGVLTVSAPSSLGFNPDEMDLGLGEWGGKIEGTWKAKAKMLLV